MDGVEYRIQQECTPNVSTERNRSINNNYVNNCFDQHFLLGPVEIRVEKTRDFYPVEIRVIFTRVNLLASVLR